MKDFTKGYYILLFLFLFACSKDEGIHIYQTEEYAQILDSIDLECVEMGIPYFIRAQINGEEICHYDSIEGRTMHFGISSKFTTASPTTTVGDAPPSNARKGMSISIQNAYRDMHEYFRIQFPDFELERDPITYLDSLTNIQYHEVMGNNDIFIPSGISLTQEGLLKKNGGFLKKFVITMNAKDIVEENGNGGINYAISTLYGTQEDSYVRFKTVEKTMEQGEVYYYVEMEFQCNLYHWPHYGQEGIWGMVTDGLLVAKFKVRT